MITSSRPGFHYFILFIISFLVLSSCPCCKGQSAVLVPDSSNVVLQPVKPAVLVQQNPIIPASIIPVAQITNPCANMPPPRYDDKQIQAFDIQLMNLRAAIELAQSFRATYPSLPNCHCDIQDLYKSFEPILAAASQANLNGAAIGVNANGNIAASASGSFGINGGISIGGGANGGLGIGGGIGLGR